MNPNMSGQTTASPSTTNARKPTRDERPWSKRGPDSAGPWDVIVIGSGMGGMTCAALLAELGKRVLVLEQHYVAGGFTHSFKRKEWTWDVGVHAVGEVTPDSMTGRLLARLTKGKLTWASLGPVYDAFHFPDGVDIDFPDNPKQFRDNLIAAFPEEERAIDDYLHRVREVAGAMKGYYLSRTLPTMFSKLADRTIGRSAATLLGERTRDVINSLTDNPRLRAVFAAQWGYYGSIPSRSSFAIQALVVKHFMWGGYYPVGGSEQIARGLLQTVADAGGGTRVRADVKSILIEDGVAKVVDVERDAVGDGEHQEDGIEEREGEPHRIAQDLHRFPARVGPEPLKAESARLRLRRGEDRRLRRLSHFGWFFVLAGGCGRVLEEADESLLERLGAPGVDQ